MFGDEEDIFDGIPEAGQDAEAPVQEENIQSLVDEERANEGELPEVKDKLSAKEPKKGEKAFNNKPRFEQPGRNNQSREVHNDKK